ncbi:MAG: hypothetical protein LBQ66_06005 [Planctomycetaceae bacterium]|jgi:hypothetical protein|nr:hypothetical protein [Planctomycetaceae bacterium]
MNGNYRTNAALNEPYSSGDQSDTIFNHDLLGGLYPDESDSNSDSPQNNMPQGIIIAHMPDLGGYKPLPNNSAQNYQYEDETYHAGILGAFYHFGAGLFAAIFGTRQNTREELDDTDILPTTNHKSHHDSFPDSYQSPRQRNSYQVPFSRLVVAGIIVLFCGIGLIVQHQLASKESSDSDKKEGTVVINRDGVAASNNASNNAAENAATNNAPPKVIDAPAAKTAADVGISSTKDKNNPLTTAAAAKNSPNQHAPAAPAVAVANSTTKPKPNPAQNQNKTEQELNKTAENKVESGSLWDRQVTDNYSPWVKPSPSAASNSTNNIRSAATEDPNDPTSKNALIPSHFPQDQLSNKHASFAVPKSPIANPTQNPNTAKTFYDSNFNTNYSGYPYHSGYSNSAATERITPPPYANTSSTALIKQPFHAPPAMPPAAGRIIVADAQGTYRNHYGNHAEFTTGGHVAQQNQNLNYSNQPVTPNRQINRQPAYLTANPNYPNQNYLNPNYPNANYTNPNYPNANYTNQNYPNTNYPNTNYSNQNYAAQYYPPTNYSANNNYSNNSPTPPPTYYSPAYPNYPYPNNTYPHATSQINQPQR